MSKHCVCSFTSPVNIIALCAKPGCVEFLNYIDTICYAFSNWHTLTRISILCVTEAVIKIRGDAGTVSTMTMQSGDASPREVKITRNLIKIDSVKWEDKGEGTAYIRVSRFGQETNAEWDRVIKEVNVNMSQLDAIVLDLRGNPGGYMVGAVYIAGEFMKNKVAVYQQEATGEQIPYRTTGKVASLLDVPAVFVLIESSESSSVSSPFFIASISSFSSTPLSFSTCFSASTLSASSFNTPRTLRRIPSST